MAVNRRTILLVDDEPHLRTLVQTTLQDPAYCILEAKDAATALEAIRRQVPDLIVLDWMMPGTSGVQLAQQLRAEPATASVPIVMLTAKGQEGDRAIASAAGVAAYIVKPFSPLELFRTVRALLGGGS